MPPSPALCATWATAPTKKPAARPGWRPTLPATLPLPPAAQASANAPNSQALWQAQQDKLRATLAQIPASTMNTLAAALHRAPRVVAVGLGANHLLAQHLCQLLHTALDKPAQAQPAAGTTLEEALTPLGAGRHAHPVRPWARSPCGANPGPTSPAAGHCAAVHHRPDQPGPHLPTGCCAATPAPTPPWWATCWTPAQRTPWSMVWWRTRCNGGRRRLN